MFIDPYIFAFGILLIFIAVNIGRAPAYARIVLVLLSLGFLGFSAHNEYREHQIEQAEIAEANRLAEIKRQEDEQKRLVAEQKQKEEEAKQLAALEEKRQREAEEQARKEKEQKLANQRETDRLKREELAKFQARRVSFKKNSGSIQRRQYGTLNNVRDCLYYYDKADVRSDRLEVKRLRNTRTVLLYNTHRNARIDVAILTFDRLEQNCVNSLLALKRDGFIPEVRAEQRDLVRVQELVHMERAPNEHGASVSSRSNNGTNSRQPTNTEDAVKGIFGAILGKALKDLNK